VPASEERHHVRSPFAEKMGLQCFQKSLLRD